MQFSIVLSGYFSQICGTQFLFDLSHTKVYTSTEKYKRKASRPLCLHLGAVLLTEWFILGLGFLIATGWGILSNGAAMVQ